MSSPSGIENVNESTVLVPAAVEITEEQHVGVIQIFLGLARIEMRKLVLPMMTSVHSESSDSVINL